jgi:hypothetical protein
MYAIGVTKHIKENSMDNTFVCRLCQKIKPVHKEGGTGYAVLHDSLESTVCYDCCGVLDKREMLISGHSKRIPLYQHLGYVSNWSDTLKFKIEKGWSGRHNMGKVYFFRFIGPDGKVWSGKQIGEFNQIAHCKRTKLPHINT